MAAAQHVATLTRCGSSGVDRLLEAFQQKYPDSPVLPDVFLGNKKYDENKVFVWPWNSDLMFFVLKQTNE